MLRAAWAVSSEQVILASCCLRPMRRNSVLEELTVKILAVDYEEICCCLNIIELVNSCLKGVNRLLQWALVANRLLIVWQKLVIKFLTLSKWFFSWLEIIKNDFTQLCKTAEYRGDLCSLEDKDFWPCCKLLTQNLCMLYIRDLKRYLRTFS